MGRNILTMGVAHRIGTKLYLSVYSGFVTAVKVLEVFGDGQAFTSFWVDCIWREKTRSRKIAAFLQVLYWAPVENALTALNSL